MKSLFFSTALLLAAAAAFSQGLPSIFQEHIDNDEVVVAHVFSDSMPTSKAFALYAHALTQMELSTPNMGAEEIQSAMLLTEEEGRSLMDELMRASAAIEKRAASDFYASACSGATPIAYGEDAFDLLQASYQYRSSAELAEYNEFMDDLGEDEIKRFGEILDKQKRRSVDIQVDYKKAFTRTRRSVDAKIAELCHSAENAK